MNSYSIFKEVLDVISLIVGIGIGLTIIIAYKQLKIMKNEFEANQYRSSVEKSLEYINKFAMETLPALKRYEAYLEKNADTSLSEFQGRAFEIKRTELSDEEVRQRGEHEVFAIVNSVDVTATVINSGIADKNSAFQSLGKSFCECVEVTIDVIEYFRRTEHVSLFSNTETLYLEWRKEFDEILYKVTV